MSVPLLTFAGASLKGNSGGARISIPGDTATHNAHCDSGHVRRTMANVDVVSGCLGRSKVIEEEIQLYFFVFPQGGDQL